MRHQQLEALSKEQLIELLEIHAKDFLALDGLWFQSIESKYGIQEAVVHDENAWKRYSQIEARRIQKFLGLPPRAGLAGLRKALQYRFNELLNECEFLKEENALVYRVVTCRVQAARERKGMERHPCKSVGMLEYGYFASAIDDRIETQVLSCHPDVVDPSCHCAWRFILREK